jgi:hypothetical protein
MEVLEVLMVVEATIEEHVKNISEVIKGLRRKVVEIKPHTTLGTPSEERVQRERNSKTRVGKIKILEQSA